jgi:hypothetical protein
VLDEAEDADAEQTKNGGQRHQAIFTLDYDSWEKFIKAFGIKEPMIPNRSDAQTQVGANGWYT